MRNEAPPMDKEEMWDLMTTTPLLSQDDSEWLVSMYAEILEQVSSKLTEDELFSLLAVGTAFYQGGRVQHEAKTLAAEAMRRAGKR